MYNSRKDGRKGSIAMKYKNIFFDADGTLLDFALAERLALAETLLHFKLPDNEEMYRGYSRANAEQWALLEQKRVTKQALRENRFFSFCQTFGLSCNIKAMADYYENALADKSFLLEGALDICRTLSRHCRLYLVTNGFHAIQARRFAASPLPPYFTDCFISEDMGAEKPDVLFFERAAAEISDFCKAETLIVGDSLSSDITGGMAFGIDTCLYAPKPTPLPKGICPTYTISSLSQLTTIVPGDNCHA